MTAAASSLRPVRTQLLAPPERRPAVRAGVPRPRLVAALAAPDPQRLVEIVAPAGFGKTLLLEEWSTRDPRPFAWLTLSPAHDSARALLRAVARAVDAAHADSADGRIVLVLDDVHVLRDDTAQDTLAAIATQLPDNVAVAMASRRELPFPLARLRVEGLVSELREGELALTRAETARLLRGAGLELARDDVDAVFRATEGWPAAVSLAVRALAGDNRLRARRGALRRRRPSRRGLPAGRAPRRTVDGGSVVRAQERHPRRADRARLRPRARALRLRRRHLAPDACRFPLVALDRTGDRYRHHRLLSALLRAELARTDAGLEAELHRRASAWYAESGDRERGLSHALAARELGAPGDLVWAGVPLSVEQGSTGRVERWLSQFTTSQIAANARLALAAAGTELVHGQGERAEHWLTAAAAATGGDRAIEGGMAALHAALGRGGLVRTAEEAEHAAALLEPGSPCRPCAG